MGRTAIIGDIGGNLPHLVDCLARLGVTATTWPADLHIVQVGDLFGGLPTDIEVARLVQPHLYAGRWTQLIGNWELGAVGGPPIFNSKGKSATPASLAMFSRWHGAGLVRYATTVTSTRGVTALVTHAGLCSTWWNANTGGELDIERVNTADQPTWRR